MVNQSPDPRPEIGVVIIGGMIMILDMSMIMFVLKFAASANGADQPNLSTMPLIFDAARGIGDGQWGGGLEGAAR